MREWEVTTTAVLLERGVIEIGDGYRAKNSEFVEGGGLPFVRVGDIGTTIRLQGLDELPAENAAKYGPKVSQTHDSVITMKGTVGRVAYVSRRDRRFVYSPQISYWRSKDPNQVDPGWLRYWLQAPEFLRQASATKGATDMADYINLRDQRRMRITLPPLLTQRKIAIILSVFDDLIENSNCRIEILEEMAQRIYREWFVEYRYPGHENRGLVNSELGPIPAGWDVHRLGDDIEFLYGKALKADARREGCVIVFGSGGAIGHHNEALSEGPGVIVGRKGNVGSVSWSDGAFFAIDTTYWIRSRLPLTYCYYTLSNMAFLDSHAAVPGLNREQAYSMPLVIPDSGLAMRFDAVAQGLFGLRRCLQDATVKLRSARDLLLERLISGAVDVTKLHNALPVVAP